METKIKNKLISDLQDNKELKNTINLEGTEDYNINAVTADVARHTMADLTLEPSFGSRTDLEDIYRGNFDGNTDKSIKYVPSDGGVFTGRVYLENPISEPADNELITSKQVTNRVADLNGAPICTWNTSDFQMQPLVDEKTDQIYKLTTVVGTTSDLDTLNKVFIHDGTSGATSKGLRVSSSANSETCKIAGIEKDQAYTDFDVIIPHRAIFRGYPDQSIIYNKPVDGLTDGAFGPADNYSNGADITSVIISNNIKAISKGAFKKCIKLSKVTLFSGVESIGEDAFSGCTALETIILPNTITSIAKNAFANCSKLSTVIYGGTEQNWASLVSNISAGNDYLKNAADRRYEPGSANNPLEGPYIYICKKEGTDNTSSNKMFLKLPNESFVEISKGAARLETPEGATTSGYYTYETLAAIIAGINTRLEALGSDTLKLPKELTVVDSKLTVIPDNVIDESVKLDTTTIEAIPTVQDLEKAILKITTGSASGANDYTTAASVQNFTDSLAAIREDLEELADEVKYELEENPNSTVNQATRIDALEANLSQEILQRTSAEGGLDTRIDALEETDMLTNIKNGYVTKTVGGISAGSKLSAQSSDLEDLLKKLLGISDGIAPPNGSFSFTISPSSITANLGTTSQNITATWSISDSSTTYTGNYTPTIGGIQGAANAKGGTISGIAVSFTDTDTSKTISGLATYSAATGFSSGTLSSSKTFTIKRTCYYGASSGTLLSADMTSTDTWIIPATAVNSDYFVIQYPKVWGPLTSITDNDTQYEALGSAFNSMPTEITKNGGIYYEYRTVNKQNGIMNFTINN